MSVFKCKMCGGTLEIQNNASVAICEYCGTQQTLPKLDSDRKANMYDRANYFRRNNEFDAAMGIYEQILAEDNTDAESYWSLVLCRYGIEYVEDPNSHKRIPTVNRAQFTSIFADADYKNAIKNADALQKKVYEAEAKTIDEIQKGILAISEKEEPFDVFICYKETDSLGRRTVDSVIAMDIYKELTKEGYKVFFSRVTLEDKLGQEYEPYIFAALNSAKVMLVLGTKTEYFDAVWVKNEWSRYLSLIKNGEKKTLIPAYRDLNPYDLPKEFTYLQAQDMGKIGFMQDLVYGIQKIIPLDKTKTIAIPMGDATGNLTELFLTNAVVALENGDFKGADTYCEKVLKTDSKNAQAYLYKLMAELSVRKEEDLSKQSVPFDKNENYKKAVQYGEKTLTLRLQSYIDQINEHIEKQKKAVKRMKKIGIIAASSAAAIALAAVTMVNFIIPGMKYSDANKLFAEERYEEAITAFEALDGFSDSETRILDCHYQIAINLMDAGKYEEAIIEFETLHGYLDSATKMMNCHYQIAVGLMNEGKYEEAIKAFEKLNDYNGSDSQIAEIEGILEEKRIQVLDDIYNKAVAFKDEENYVEALLLFEQLGDYRDSATLLAEIRDKMPTFTAYEVLTSVYRPFLDNMAPLYGVQSGEEIKTSYVGKDMETITEGDFSYDIPKAAPSEIDLSNDLYMTYLPQKFADKIDSAAIFFNILNVNTNGTFSSFEVKNTSDIQIIADALKDELTNNIWLCGSPERYCIAKVDNIIISAFASRDIINAFKNAVTETFENAVILYDDVV